MVTQNSKKGNHEEPAFLERQLPDVHAQLEALQEWVYQSAQDGSSAHAVERELFRKVLELAKTVLRP